MDKLIDKVSQLLVLVGLAAQQIGDIMTGQAQASHVTNLECGNMKMSKCHVPTDQHTNILKGFIGVRLCI